jgi:hypothetical protein
MFTACPAEFFGKHWMVAACPRWSVDADAWIVALATRDGEGVGVGVGVGCGVGVGEGCGVGVGAGVGDGCGVGVGVGVGVGPGVGVGVGRGLGVGKLPPPTVTGIGCRESGLAGFRGRSSEWQAPRKATAAIKIDRERVLMRPPSSRSDFKRLELN